MLVVRVQTLVTSRIRGGRQSSAASTYVTNETMQRMNAAKNLLALVVNLVSSTTYILVAADRIDWTATTPVAGGSLIGGFLGAHYGRRLPSSTLRVCVVVFGLIALWRITTL